MKNYNSDTRSPICCSICGETKNLVGIKKHPFGLQYADGLPDFAEYLCPICIKAIADATKQKERKSNDQK